jgi:hypothetical protein
MKQPREVVPRKDSTFMRSTDPAVLPNPFRGASAPR